MSRSSILDVVIIGGGLVGLATARALTESMRGIGIAVLEKEAEVGRHQSSHNSGVVHSGLYYKPGSLKARLCSAGRESTYEMCESAGIAYRRSGKLVVATDAAELPTLDELERRGRANGLQAIDRLGPSDIKNFEPAATGIGALHVGEAGVADFSSLASYHLETIIGRDAIVSTGTKVVSIRNAQDYISAVTDHDEFRARVLVNCAGLQSDLIAMLAGIQPQVRIVPFRGEYYRLTDETADQVRALIYPVPDPRFPFLGVHFTRRFDGTVEVGPNAILAHGREHYRGSRANIGEAVRTVMYPGFQRLARRHWKAGLAEMVNSRSRRRYAKLARRLLPTLSPGDLVAGGSGVRAQAVDRSGRLVDDFVIERTDRSIHVLNAPSPAATASPAIGQFIAAAVRATLRA